MKFFKRTAILLVAVQFTRALAQSGTLPNCNCVIKGHVEGENMALEGAAVYLRPVNKGTVTDASGTFKMDGLCPGEYELMVSYVGFKPKTVAVDVKKTSHIDVTLVSDSVFVPSIEVTAKRYEYAPETQPVATIEGKALAASTGLPLAEALKQVPGVHAIQTGPTISKPMVHGLHSNRILLINNGIRQEGQQWGAEHAPEIDAFIADRLTVIKGAASIRYGSDAMGGVVLVEPKQLPLRPGIGGEWSNVAMSNGRLGATSLRLEGALGKNLSGFSWRLQASGKRAGNFETPRYFMENTGLSEANISATVDYKHQNWGLNLYVSSFNTQLGIFTGAEAGNIDDMKAAIARSQPNTPSYFSYALNRPYQQVSHQLVKAAFFIKGATSRLELVAARQYNNRKEYGYIPVTGSELPQLHLQLETYTFDAVHHHHIIKNTEGMLGFNGISQNNTELTGSLNPDFKNYSGGLFAIEKWRKNRWVLEGGLRFDYRWLKVFANPNLGIAEKAFDFTNWTGNAGLGYQLNAFWSLQANVATAWRSPTVSELYANGVDLGVGGYVKGRADMKVERSYQLSASLHYGHHPLELELALYRNVFENFIYLNPSLAYINTRTGAFPLFNYTQAHVTFNGADVSAKLHITPHLNVAAKGSLLYAYNYSANDYLIQTPANRLESTLAYDFGNWWKLNGWSASLTNLWVARQNRVPANSDYSPPPPGYHLMSLSTSFDVPLGKRQLSIHLGVNNLFNVVYRDYLNRFRYFTDEQGRNFILRTKFDF